MGNVKVTAVKPVKFGGKRYAAGDEFYMPVHGVSAFVNTGYVKTDATVKAKVEKETAKLTTESTASITTPLQSLDHLDKNVKVKATPTKRHK